MNRCNQCNCEMKEKRIYLTARGKKFIQLPDYFCINIKCPNYGLVQIPTEQMPKETK
jgi:hypothetical protein